jgi:hypothetical protein
MASMDVGGAFDELADSGFWVEAAMVFGGWLGPNVAANVIEGNLNQDLPNELYGIGTAAASEMVIGERMITVGAGIYTVDQLVQRFGLKQTVTTLGA